LMQNVSRICANGAAFSALRTDGSVVTWGWASSGGDSRAVRTQLSGDVRHICSTREAFAAIKTDGSVVMWGSSQHGGSGYSLRESIIEVPGRRTADVVPVSMKEQLMEGVEAIYATDGAFAVVKVDNSVVAWGASASGGDCSAVRTQLQSGVSRIYSTAHAFAALKDDGSVVAWGSRMYGGDTGAARSKLFGGVQHVASTGMSFAAIKTTGSVVVWGDSYSGGGITPNALRVAMSAAGGQGALGNWAPNPKAKASWSGRAKMVTATSDQTAESTTASGYPSSGSRAAQPLASDANTAKKPAWPMSSTIEAPPPLDSVDSSSGIHDYLSQSISLSPVGNSFGLPDYRAESVPLSPVGNSFGLPDYRAPKPPTLPSEDSAITDAIRSSKGVVESLETKHVPAASQHETVAAWDSPSGSVDTVTVGGAAAGSALNSPPWDSSPPRSGRHRAATPDKVNGTPQPVKPRKIDPMELARRSDAFWAKVEADLAPAAGSGSATGSGTSKTSGRRGSSTGASKKSTKLR
jgi:hypothetical protein